MGTRGKYTPGRMRRWSVAVTGALAAALLVAPQTTAQPVTPAENPPGSGEWHTITLVTGDRVRLHVRPDGQHDTIFAPGPGREDVGYSTRTDRGRFYLVPSDVAPLIAADRVDAELFDLTAMVADGLDDAHSAHLPLIVQYDPGSVLAAAVAPPPGAADGFVLSSINARSVVQHKDQAGVFWPAVAGAGAVRKVWRNGKVTALLDRSVPQVGAPQAWAGGFDGTGVKIAVVDTGIDTTHPDLDGGKVVAEANFSSEPDASDGNGHGTHVASTAAGTGEATAVVRRGVAPGAALLNAKALDRQGNGTDDAVIRALEWAAAQDADVINMSVGGGPATGPDAVSMAVDAVSRDSGALVVAAAGNLGNFEGTITSPGWADEALTVAAVNHEDVLADFSSIGPRGGDLAIKPDLVAPGVGIVAARASGTTGSPIVDERYARRSGTSMATPHVAGAAAILAQQHPAYGNTQLKDALISTARTGAGMSPYEQGGGRLDVARAFAQRVYAGPGTLNLGYLRWPHPAEPVSRAVTFTNATAAEVTLDLSLQVTHQDGSTPPAGMFTVDRPRVTVPAGGTASVAVALDPAAGPTGRYVGYLVGTGGDTVVHTSVGVFVEPETHEVSVTAVAHSGRLQAASRVVLWSPASGHLEQYVEGDRPTVTFRVPPGTYTAVGFLSSADDSGDRVTETAFVGDLELAVTDDTALTLDGRTANRIVVDTELPTTTNGVSLGFHRALDGQDDSDSQLTPRNVPAFAAPTEPVTKGDFEFYSKWDLIAPPDDQGSPPAYEYDLFLSERQRVPEVLSYRADHTNTATLDTWYRADTPDTPGMDVRWAARPDYRHRKEFQRTVPRPGKRTYFVSAGDVRWTHEVWMTRAPGDLASFTGAPTSYRLGEVLREEWFGRPAGPGPRGLVPPATRTGDTLDLRIAPYVDTGGHWNNQLAARDVHRTTLHANGEQVVDYNGVPGLSVPVRPDPTTYRLNYTNERSAPWWQYSTRTDTTWTFGSSRPADGRTDRIPLLELMFRPQLDEYNRAPGGGSYGFPLHVGHVAGATGAPIASVTGRASSDDGRTWSPMRLLDLGGGDYVAQLQHPASGAVSLHVTATDTAGNAIDQTIIRAYGVVGS
ncbi:S8 family serine peptidase [Actinosynnema sp. NPDC047251]|uniref:Peptidase S8/S53, subtilisin kexin sedolisin n=1 Tax=Saccharothrix espanaensis (strain ATCC 51144 / DSM 44229 / JCM 9112 / NBRC 15066 / NRRL 15764) TaxID=1179773 RepID=K0JXN3_SACES|nr:S8 family serine peptidase [Saccharothrix espanaensis]CCH32650.1 Peptidase S8/S53, subtilisin kexin sedolisin [Saccharothrix espanaensis DSM 44229]